LINIENFNDFWPAIADEKVRFTDKEKATEPPKEALIYQAP
jgi:hypothetical protein